MKRFKLKKWLYGIYRRLSPMQCKHLQSGHTCTAGARFNVRDSIPDEYRKYCMRDPTDCRRYQDMERSNIDINELKNDIRDIKNRLTNLEKRVTILEQTPMNYTMPKAFLVLHVISIGLSISAILFSVDNEYINRNYMGLIGIGVTITIAIITYIIGWKKKRPK